MNFDDIYERAAQSVTSGTCVIKNYSDADVWEIMRGDKRYILKVHGGVANPDSMIFTQRDYAKARARFSAFYNLMSAALRTETFLFVGCGRSDPDLTLLLEEYAYDFSVAAVPHYYLTAIGMHEDEKSSLRLNRNLKVIECDPVNVEHSGLVDELKNLGEQVEAEREELIQTRNW